MSDQILKSILDELKNLREEINEVKNEVSQSSIMIDSIYDTLNMENDEDDNEGKITIGVLKAFYKAIKERDERIQESIKKMTVVLVSYVESSLRNDEPKKRKEIKKDLVTLAENS